MDLALFDFDGTITDRETMPDFMYRAVRPHRLLLGKVLLLPWMVGYKAGIVSGTTIRAAICLFGFWRIPATEVEAHGREFAERFLSVRLREEVMARIAWHKSRGDTVVIVSGGLGVYLAPWCKAQEVELVCSCLEQRRGRLTGRYLGRQCVRAEKVRRVRERYPLEKFSRIFAYGDTPEDHEMLALAHERYYRGKPPVLQ